MVKVVIDTNVIISGFFWKGNESLIIDLCVNGLLRNHTSLEILSEVEEVMRYIKFGLTERETEVLLKRYISFSTIVVPSNLNFEISRDPTDDKFISCSISSGSSYLITGDKDLLELRNHNGISILNSKEMLQRIEDGLEC
jgi:putative PIN family toxin of toxin-antitoxin system